VATRTAVQLEAAGYTTVLQAWDFRPGSDLLHQMRQASTSASRRPSLALWVTVTDPDPAVAATGHHAGSADH
jgi:hypothetical protein